MTTKVCSKCGEQKPLAEYDRRDTKAGYRLDCKTCCKARHRAYVDANREELYAKNRAYYAENRESILSQKTDSYDAQEQRERNRRYREQHGERLVALSRAYYAENRERLLLDKQRYAKDNPHIITANANKRRAAKLQRAIKLSPEHEAELKRIYASAKHISEKTEILHHVDHIVPLQGKMMSGLHVPWNLEVVPARDNLAKSNKVDYSRALPTCMDRVDA